jgi:hypothetical protein
MEAKLAVTKASSGSETEPADMTKDTIAIVSLWKK